MTPWSRRAPSDTPPEPARERAPAGTLGAVRGAATTVAVLLALGVGAAWWAFRTPSVSPPALAPTFTTVAPGIHLLGRTFPNASYAVETSEGLVLVDTCPEPDAGPVLRQLREAGLDVDRLRCILLTHAHGDHSLGAQRLRRMTGAKVHAGAADCDVLRAGGPKEAFFSIFSMPQDAHATEIDVELTGGEVIEVGGASFRVIATPGHTPGSLCYLLERDGLEVLFTGDTVMSLTDTEQLTGPGIYPAYLSPRYRGSAVDSLASLRRLRAMNVPDLVLPGHPAADPEPQSPRLTQRRWDDLLGNAIAKLEALVRRYEEDGADFLDGIAKEILPGVHYWGNYGGSAVYGLVSPTGESYLFDAPGGPGLVEFLTERFAQSGVEPKRPSAVLLTSCSPESRRGLRSVVEAWGCLVVAPRAGLDALRAGLPPETRFLASEDLPATGWFPAVVVPIQGLGDPAAAYVVHWKSRTIVLSGREPTRTTIADGVVLHRSVRWRGEDPRQYLQSLDALGTFTPDVWLPAVPINGQNANLYDTEWRQVLESNRRLLE